MKIFLCAVDTRLTGAWRRALPQTFGPAVAQVIEGDILSLQVDAVVSPANSFGFMDGGLDALYTRFFGPQLQERLQRMIREQADGELLVGQALPVETGHARIPWCISAPTMRVPRRLESAEPAYLATRAAVRCALAAGVARVAIPGMGTGTGGLPPESAAPAMLRGIQDAFHPQPFPASLADVPASF
ncbi:macro domain-containing protein [uncultured Desulfovibrio sp.]|uniref:macro domain-containing protein n=1 Tax=uncultured Desulfovibrio sp. TaxID=167968 RepID=UPI0026224689|nr:macro domain-containing protein [uncultured Desulfovibrio sp.]